MTNPNNQTNGASLEDCHTNFFALTDLSGIKWRKVVWTGEWNEGGGEVLEDPVLASYVRCMAADILCVWRRVATPRPVDPPHALFDQLGLPPAPPPPPTPHHPPLSLQTAKELWIFWYGEQPDLSNLISADLLASDGEQGSWENGLSYECRSLLFKALHNLIERCLLSRDFVRLGKWYIQPYDSNEKILERSGHLSFAFDFFVHGESHVCASVDVRQHPPVRTLLAKHLQQAHASLNSSPPVQVILAPFGLAGTLTGQSFRNTDPQTQRLLDSWRQFYPIDKGLDNSELPPAVEVLVGGVKMRYPTSYVLITDIDDSTASLFNNQMSVAPTAPPPRVLYRGPSLAEQVWHESCISQTVCTTNAGGSNNGIGTSSGTGDSHSNTPVLSSSPAAAASGQWNFVDPTRKQACSCSCKTGCSSSGGGGVEGSESGAVCSPSSVTGSPGATNSIPPPDPAMPTLSPQPPPAHHPSPVNDKVVPTPTDFSAPKSVSSISNQMLSPYGGEVVGSVGGGSVGKSAEGKHTPPAGRAAVPPAATPPPPQTCPTVPKRPSLSTLDYEDALFQELHPSPLLYDYSTLEAWWNHPVKRFKPQNQNITVPLQTQQQQVVPQLQSAFKQEPQSISPSPKLEVDGGCAPGSGDPYEFDDEAAANRADNFRTTPIPNIKEEDKGLVNGAVPMQTQIANENLFTNEGLTVSFNDLDQIFEHPEEPPFDALQMPTPPNPEGGDSLVGLCPGGYGSTVSSRGGILRPEELSKMFPTPPSLEHIPVASPITSSIFTESDFALTTTIGSPNHEPITDWSYVYKPPEACKFVGPSKYAPLTILPSHSLPPVALPSNLQYKPTWATYLEKQQSNSRNQQQQQQQQQSSTNIQQPPSVPQVGTPRSIPEPSPSPGWGGPPSHPMPPHHHMMPRQNAPPPPYSPSPYKLDPPPSPPRPEANSLVVIVLLGDSALNIFRDHNFDSCTFCVCNAGSKVVGNIKGGDAGVYLPGMMGGGSPFMSPSPHMMPPDDEPIRCNCGFSAVVNRRLSYKAGLFIEDELEITGYLDENVDRENDKLTGIVMELMRDQCLVPGSWSNSVIRAAAVRPLTPPPAFNVLALRDATALSSIALEQGRIASLHPICKMEMDSGCVGVGRSGVHKWCYLRARGPSCNQDIIRVMKQLQPLLQDAIQKKCGAKLWEAPTISGPLTWRQFHRLAGRVTGNEDRSGPQPIPSLLVGRDKDWVSLSPYAVHLWEKLLLEPYSYSRDIAYIVVAPDSDFVLHRVRHFFRELSSMYEVCKLGRHFPITKILRDGILRVGKSASQKLANEPLDDWFQMLNENSTNNMLKLYAQVCRYHLAPHLSTMANDKTLLEQSNDKPQPSPRTPALHDHQDPLVKQEPTEECQSQSCGGSTPTRGNETVATPAFSSSQNSLEDEDLTPPHVVVYLVEPFSVGSDNPDLQKLSCIAMLRVYNTVLQNVPEALRTNLQLQIISLESIIELGKSCESERRIDHMRSLALSVFNQCKRLMHHSNAVKALTGFGTVATNEVFLKNKDEKSKKPYKVFQPAYILAEKHKHTPVPTGSSGEVGGSPGNPVGDKCCVLYVSYCLSEDQRWLLASATDDSGLLLDSVSINIHIPNRSRRRKASARRQGLPKLMDFILGLMSQSVVPWRLVISRIGRIGHGELKGWSWLLSRKQLLKASKQLKEMCIQCSVLYPNDVPCILSACLVSLEPDSSLRLMPDQFTPDERFSQSSTKCHLSTPTDVSSTHILVFPTSATTQSSQSVGLEPNLSDPDLVDDDLLLLPVEISEGMTDGDFNVNDIFSWPEGEAGHGGRSPGSPGRNGSRSQPASPTQQGGPVQSSIRSPFSNHNNTSRSDGSEEVGTLLQQPLALGYLVSTVPTGRMPRWFWSACPHLEAVCPAFLKNALHLHSTAVLQNSDELLHQQTTPVVCHPLDSQVTTDVLRYVLEGYNALSWLALDSNTHDRLSCLPVHMQILMQLYHMTSALT